MAELQYFNDYYKIIETTSFCIFVPKYPHVDRTDGGHICISAIRQEAYLLQDLSDKELFELSILQKLVGAAMIDILNKNGVDVQLINYQINGNWTFQLPNRPSLHVHIYGRALSALKQPFGHCLNLPLREINEEFYEKNVPLNIYDRKGICEQILKHIKKQYSDVIIIRSPKVGES